MSDNLRKTTEQGDAKAQNNLVACYYLGKGIKKSKSKAIFWLRKACENFNDKVCKMLNQIKKRIKVKLKHREYCFSL